MITSNRLVLREITQNDFDDLKELLQDNQVMYAWEHTFTDKEVSEWINNQIQRYNRDKIGYWVAIDKEKNTIVGQIGLLVEEINGEKYYGIGYILKKKYWNKGYAMEGAKACLDYAFSNLNATKVICDIRPENKSSRKVAEKLGMKVAGEFIKNYRNKEMIHLIYEIER